MSIAGIILYATKKPLVAFIYFIITVALIILITFFLFIKEIKDQNKVHVEKKQNKFDL